ncbi:MAG: mechanosensitive ion channel [Rickettsia sp.]|nr:mechanosensitive ion channel [Rickettsia sp.]
MEKIWAFFQNISTIGTLLIIFIISFLPIILFLKKILVVFIQNVLKIKESKYLDMIQKHNLLKYLNHSIISLYLIFWIQILEKIFLSENFFTEIDVLAFFSKIRDWGIFVYSTIYISNLFISIVNIYVEISKTSDNISNIKLYSHITRIVIIIVSFLIIISNILNISFTYLFTSLGATAAFLAFVFKDSLLGLVASLQISLQDIVKVGDTVRIDSYSLEGTVEDITITVVKIRNFDQTISTVPTITFVNSIVINYRFMHESQARRIKRAFNIDIKTIKYCSEKVKRNFKNLNLIRKLYSNHNDFLDLSLDITNIDLLKIYLSEYLKTLEDVHKSDFVFLVRQKDSIPQGLPIEIYIFNKNTAFEEHENLQYKIFSHIFTILPVFELEVFQVLSSNKDKISLQKT